MVKRIIIVLVMVIFALGCARVRVETPKEGIKVDISMRLDIYQHVSKDIDDIESMVSGRSSDIFTKALRSGSATHKKRVSQAKAAIFRPG